MNSRLITLIAGVLCIFNIFVLQARGAEFDELDKPPEGAYGGQMLLGGFISIGKPLGNIIDAENTFVEDQTHTFENEVTKLIKLSHMSFGLGLTYEYMPIDHLGAKVKFRRSIIIQRTVFGSEYKNWRLVTYSDYSLYVGPSFHATTRKTWDFVFTPFIGYAYGEYNATPVADELKESYDAPGPRSVSGLTYGAELLCTIYFSGGLFVSFGGEWTRNNLNFGSAYTETYSGGDPFLDGATSGTIDNICFTLGAGYAFKN